MGRLKNVLIIVVSVVVAYIAVTSIPSFILGPTLNNSNLEGFFAGSGSTVYPHDLYLAANFTLNSTSKINASYGGTSRIIFLAFDQNELDRYISNQSISPNLFESNATLSGSANFTVGAGTVYLTLYDPGNASAMVSYSFTATKVT